MERVLLLGCSGSGKSTLARTLGVRLDLPVVHLDRIFWKSGWTNVTREEFDARLTEALETPRWVIDGNYDRTLALRLSYCDTAVYLDYPRRVCLAGIAKRVLTGYGRTRPDMAEGCPEHVDVAFLRWIWNFQKKERPKAFALLDEAEKNGVRTLRFTSRRECRQWLRALPAKGTG